MRRLVATLAVLCLPVSVFAANGYRKSYFGATVPGAWAKYKTKTSYGTSVDGMKRLKDDEGRVRYQLDTEYVSGQFKGTKAKNWYTFNKSYPSDRDGLDYLKYIAAASGEAAGNIYHLDEQALTGMRGVPQYAPALVFEGSETIDGKQTDRYGYTISTPSGPETGKYWLSDQVPFGIVKHTSSGKDATGKVNNLEQVLTASGVSAPEEPMVPKTKQSKKKSRD